MEARWRSLLNGMVLVCALGYFVDVYDLLLFSVVRAASLTDLGVPASRLLDVGVFLLNVQMAGLLVGGIVWGILGDKRGRRSVLFGSIALYSLANLANAFVQDTTSYAILRFLAGVGLAGELGAAITLVTEALPAQARGYGAAIVAGLGITGAIAAALVGALVSWRVAFALGGLMGLALLALRVRLSESGLFAALPGHERGRLSALFASRRAAGRWLLLVLAGVPVWFVVGILVTFSPELAKPLAVSGAVTAGSAILWCYVGIAGGGFFAGAWSERAGSRKRVVGAFLGLILALTLALLLLRGLPLVAFYALCAGLGFASGYWSALLTSAAEAFGTNVRATVVTTVPNLIRGAVVPLTLALQWLRPTSGLVGAALLVGLLSVGAALMALSLLPETHGAVMDRLEDGSTPVPAPVAEPALS